MDQNQIEPEVLASQAYYARIPKVELHLHLEGAIPLDALFELIQKYGGDPEVPDPAALEKRFAYRDFPHFIQTWLWKCQYHREYDDFTLIARAVARDLAAQNVRYAEAFYSPPDYYRHGLEPQRLTAAIRAGLDEVKEIEIALVPDLVRDRPPEEGLRLLEQLAEVRELGVVGVGLGGSEQSFPPEPFAGVYERARQLGLHTSCHAGEAAGAASIWGALRDLHAERIGHGTRAYEDPLLLEYLVHHAVPVEMCPTSNLRTGVVKSLAEHPIRRYDQMGLKVCVNTDDPKMFGISLAEEYTRLECELGFSRADVLRLVLQGIEYSWLPEAKKQAMAQEFRGLF